MWLRNWRWTIARGVAAIIFGLIALMRPGTTWVVMMSFFAAYALVDGIGAIVASLSKETRQDRPWGLLLFKGVLGILVAAMWVAWPASTSLGFLFVIGTWAILGGLLEIGSAIRLRRIIQHEWKLALAGVLSIAFGLLVWMRPGVAALALVWWLGAYALVFGALLVGLGFRMRHFTRGTTTRALPLDQRLRHQT